MRRLLWCGVCLLTFGVVTAVWAQAVSSSQPLTLVRITPAGDDVPAGRQVVFEFDRPVAPLGRMERRAEEIPIAITPALACAWRWLTPTTLACQLGAQQAMALATRYTVTVQPGLQAADGTTLAAAVSHTFLTKRPQVSNFWWRHWSTPGTPHLVLSFDQAVSSASIAQHVYLRTTQRVAVNVTADKEGKERVWIVTPVTALPPDTRVTLHVEPGIVATAGPEVGIEQRLITEFTTFPALRFLGVRCVQDNGDPLQIAAASKTLPRQRCDSLQEVSLQFSAPVTKEALKDVLQITPALPKTPAYDPWEDVGSWSRLGQGHSQGDTYDVRLPSPPLKAYTTYRLQAPAGGGIKDEFGRVLPAALDVQFATAHRQPGYHLSHPLSVLEQQVETHVPIVVTNLQKLHLRYETLTTQGRQAPPERVLPLYTVRDIAYAFPLPMRQLLPAPSGALQGTLTTTPALRQKPQWFFSQVTPFHVHVKIGHYTTLVWATRFDTGQPVPGALVQLYADTLGTFAAQPTILAQAITNAAGIATLEGVSTLDPALQRLAPENDKAPRLFVRLQKDEDLALLPLLDYFQVEASGTNETYIETNLERRYQHIRTWGSTPQGVYRAGDTVQFTLYVRNQDNQRLVPAPRTGYTLRIIDPTGKTVHTVNDVRLSEFGSYAGEFLVAQNAAVGWYRFLLAAAFAKTRTSPQDSESPDEDAGTGRWEPMRVLISDFTPAAFRVTTDVHGTAFAMDEQVTITTQAALHAGGPYGTAPARLTATVRGQSLVPESAQAAGFVFAVSAHAGQDPTPAPAKSPEAEGEEAENTTEDFAETVEQDSETVWQREELLPEDGTLETTFVMPQAQVLYGTLEIESAVRDDRGKYVAGRTSARYTGRDRYVGLYQADWVLQVGTAAPVQALVVDAQGMAVAGTPVRLEVAQLHTTAAQVKSAGNAYLPQYTHTWQEVTTCTLVSSTTPAVCPFTPPAAGTYKMTARITDTRGRVHRTSLRRWAVGAGQVLWEQSPTYTLPIFPEKPTYHVGDTARYLIQNPFPGAQALVTLERFGVQRSWLETFHNSTAVVEFPVQPEQLPGFYLSVVVMSPRVDKPLLNNVDLGKPAFRMGYVQVPVQDAYKELRVEVTPRQAVYKPRQTASVDIVTHTRQGDKPPLELAVAVLDEAVFDLIATGKDYFDPYKGFYHLEPLDLRNYNLLTQLVGRQKFEKKGATHGGDGGLDLDLRSVLKFVSYWNPALRPDPDGKATISFALPDNLTGWRVLAMAVTPEDRMGLGEGHFRTNQATEIRPALPNHVLEGDHFDASFTVMNRTDASRTLAVTLRATGPVQPEAIVQQRLEAEPYKRYHVRLPLQTTGAGDIHLQVRAEDGQDGDALELPLAVHKRQTLEVAATYGTLSADEVTTTITFPPDIRPDVGGLSVIATPTVLGNLAGAFQYLRDYPYACWEQVLTKGVAAAQYHSLSAYLPDSVSWPESTALPVQTLARAANYQAPNGGMTYYVPKDDYVSPDLSAYTALAFNWLRASGHAIPAPVESKLQQYLLTFLRHNSGPDFYTRGMHATVRAMILAALAPHHILGRDEVLRLHMHVPAMSLFGKAHYLLALVQFPDTLAEQAEIVQAIRAHGHETSGKLVFSEQVDTAYQRLLDSSLRTNCAVLSALLAADAQHGSGSDAPFKIVRTISEDRQRQDRWENTQENIFCMQALADFSRAFEQTPPHLTLQAFLDGTPFGTAQFQGVQSAAVDMRHPLQAADVGRQATLTLRPQGQGRLYYTTRLSYSPQSLPTEPVNAGLELHREYSVERGRGWLLLQDPMQVQTGELLKVDLYLSLAAAHHFVVVDDPVPGGLEPVNRDLATASTVDAAKASVPFAYGARWFHRQDWRSFGSSRWSFYHKELRHQAARFYSEYLSPGHYHLSYVAQAISAGEFVVLPAQAEEMYHPETFGRSAPAQLHVVLPGTSEAKR